MFLGPAILDRLVLTSLSDDSGQAGLRAFLLLPLGVSTFDEQAELVANSIELASTRLESEVGSIVAKILRSSKFSLR